eukprot:GHVU01083912.1.p1 GENE.GHVU01083912.1~~GHVU01083912.1.p1  ORF type:complete len:106 (+),score=1.65 GHVU01083912.1:131-448(+)
MTILKANLNLAFSASLKSGEIAVRYYKHMYIKYLGDSDDLEIKILHALALSRFNHVALVYTCFLFEKYACFYCFIVSRPVDSFIPENDIGGQQRIIFPLPLYRVA